MSTEGGTRAAALPWFLQLPFVGLALVLGLAYRYGEPVRTSSPSFDPARDIMTIASWGDVFLVGAVVMGFGLLHPKVQVGAFIVGGGIYILWGCFFARAMFTVAGSSLSAWATFGFIAFCHYLAAWRILLDERTRT